MLIRLKSTPYPLKSGGRCRRAQAGLSLIELILATVVLVIGLIPTIGMVRNMSQGLDNREKEVKSLMLAQNLMEQIREEKWDEKTGDPTDYVASPSSLQADSGETSISQYDDVDDYNGYTDVPVPNFSRSVEVSYVTIDLNDNMVDSVNPTDFKRIRVSVVPGGSAPKTHSVEVVVINE